MAMKNQKGIVRYQGRDDIVCSYGIRDDGKQFYYLDVNNAAFKNGCRVASTALVEAVDPMVKASNVGLVDGEGNEVIPFNNRSIRPVNDDVILVEPAAPTSNSVIEAIQLKSDPLAATKLVSTPALIKDKLNAQVGEEGRYLFNDQFSEATVCDINGNNLVNGEKYSFIATNGKELYFSKNTADSDITSYSLLPPEVQSDVTPANDSQDINVNEVVVEQDVIEDALSNDTPESNQSENQMNEQLENESSQVSVEEEIPVSNETEEISPSESVDESVEDVSIESPVEDVVQEDPITSEVVIPEDSLSSSDEAVEENGLDSVEDSTVEENQSDFAVLPTNEETTVEENTTVDDINDVVGDNQSIDNDTSSVPATVGVTPVDYSELEDMADTFDVPESVLDYKDTDEEESNVVVNYNNSSEKIENSAITDEGASESVIDSAQEEVSFSENVQVDEPVEDTIDEVEGIDLSFDDFDTDQDDIFKNSSVNVDHIDVDDFAETVPDVDTTTVNKGNIMIDAAKTMTAMMNKIREQEAELNETRGELNKSREANSKLKKMTYLLKEKVEAQQNKLASSEAHCAQLESKYNMMEGRLREQNRVINSQAQELAVLRPYAQGEEEMADIIASSKELLGTKVR